eukprot:SAG11_NODE_277_length_11302_cov_5.987146_8_plen_119_part_00
MIATVEFQSTATSLSSVFARVEIPAAATTARAAAGQLSPITSVLLATTTSLHTSPGALLQPPAIFWLCQLHRNIYVRMRMLKMDYDERQIQNCVRVCPTHFDSIVMLLTLLCPQQGGP